MPTFNTYSRPPVGALQERVGGTTGHRSECEELIDAGEYLRGLASSAGSKLGGKRIAVIASAGGMPLQFEKCRRLGLVVNELLANAARAHCFGRQEARVEIELTCEGSFVHCAVTDNFSVAKRVRPSRDLNSANVHAKSLNGRIGHWFDDQGDSFVVTLPLTEREQQVQRSAQAPDVGAARPVEAAHPRHVIEAAIS